MIGQMRERVTIQEYALSDDGAGGRVKAWADLSESPAVWAHVKSASGAEGIQEGRTVATASVVFTIRNRLDLDERMRINWRGTAYDIRSILSASYGDQYLKIEAERGV